MPNISDLKVHRFCSVFDLSVHQMNVIRIVCSSNECKDIFIYMYQCVVYGLLFVVLPNKTLVIVSLDKSVMSWLT